MSFPLLGSAIRLAAEQYARQSNAKRKHSRRAAQTAELGMHRPPFDNAAGLAHKRKQRF